MTDTAFRVPSEDEARTVPAPATTRSASLLRRGRPPTPLDTAVEPIARPLASTLEHRHPAVAAVLVIVLAYVALTAAVAAVGVVLLQIVLADGRGSWDVIGVNRWFADRFDATMSSWSLWGTRLADTTTVLAIAGLVAVAFLVARRWRMALFVVTALTLEVTVFLTMTLLFDRERPDVPKPDAVPPTSSYPSGHTAAGTALYLAIAILVAIHVRNRFARVTILVAGVLPGLFVGLSRIARGMHHPTDVLVGFLLGLACVAAAAVTVAVADRVAARRTSEVAS